jgi:glycosyltransferase involved in cell wall biosynthesis
LKVLHLVQKPQLRGAEIFTSQLSAHIKRSGHDAAMAFLFPGSNELPFKDSIFHLNGKMSRRFSDIKAWRKLAHIIKDEKPDIIQANAGDTLKYAVFSKLLFRWKQPIVFRNASTISLYIKSGLGKKWNGFFFKYADKIISVSEASAIDFANLYPQYKHRIATIPIGIDTDSDNKVDKKLDKLGYTAPSLIHVGGFTHEKNHRGLLSIFSEVLKRLPDAQLHLIGDGPLRSQTEQLCRDKGISTSVHFHGFQKNAMQYIKEADILLLPSLIEGLPGVILEAFFCKTPVVAYNVGGIKEVVINNETGYLIKKGDEKGFTNAILATLESPEKHKIYIEKAYELVTSKYLNTQVAQDFLNLYAAVIAA